MLHILWMLIKWILILLGVLLGLVLCLLLLILFCPVRYRLSAVKKEDSFEDAEGAVKVSWLFGGISFSLKQKMRTRSWELRILGISAGPLLNKIKNRKKPSAGQGAGETEERLLELHTENPQQQAASEEMENTRQQTASEEVENSRQQTASEETKNPRQHSASEEPILPEENLSSGKRNKFTEFREKLRTIGNRLKDIPAAFHRIALTIRNICDKIDWWKEFWEHPRTKAGAAYARSRLWRLLKHVFPMKAGGYVRFGSEDPSITGMALAVLGMTVPLHKNRIEIAPVFENRNLLEGKVAVKGRIYGIVPLIILLELYFNKDIKNIIYRWKHKEA